MKQLPALFFKAHVKGYTRKDGTAVRPHEDGRQASLFDDGGGSQEPSSSKTANSGGVPMFETYKDAQEWLNGRAKEVGGLKRFSSMPEYAAAYPKIKELYDVEHASRTKDAMTRLSESGMKVGDKVSTSFVGPFFQVTQLSGVITTRSGIPHVKLSEKITVSKNGKLYESASMQWDNRWKLQGK